MRAVPLMDAAVHLLRDHLHERPEHAERPLFQERQGGHFSRSGVRYIRQNYVRAVQRDHPGFTQPVSPHSLRHTKGMHLVQSGYRNRPATFKPPVASLPPTSVAP